MKMSGILSEFLVLPYVTHWHTVWRGHHLHPSKGMLGFKTRQQKSMAPTVRVCDLV